MPRPKSKAPGQLYDRYIGDDPERVASFEKALTNAEVATASSYPPCAPRPVCRRPARRAHWDHGIRHLPARGRRL